MNTTESSVLTNLRDLYDLDASRRAEDDAREARRIAAAHAAREAMHRERRAREAQDRERETARIAAAEAARAAEARARTQAEEERVARLHGLELAEVERVRLELASIERQRRREAEIESARLIAARSEQRARVVSAGALIAALVVAAGFGAFVIVQQRGVELARQEHARALAGIERDLHASRLGLARARSEQDERRIAAARALETERAARLEEQAARERAAELARHGQAGAGGGTSASGQAPPVPGRPVLPRDCRGPLCGTHYELGSRHR